ncbi:T9SS type A sorting domain-containing protein [Flavobacterium sp.]|uniref:T9SS type A sorting domain-containing protein n=1 Tax=Flavobacterium sp. TaxID=239 RepID=UPI0025F1E487|nr:T9SS type A sorting domain-containing protein [Flavobacterium sp.]
MGGDIDLLLTITDKDKICQTPFKITLLNCGGESNEGRSKAVLPDELINSMALYPNPAQNELHIAFTAVSNDSEIAIYDLTGRLIISYAAKEPKGDWTLSLNNYAAGVYVVVLFEHGQVVLQKKLIKD